MTADSTQLCLAQGLHQLQDQPKASSPHSDYRLAKGGMLMSQLALCVSFKKCYAGDHAYVISEMCENKEIDILSQSQK